MQMKLVLLIVSTLAFGSVAAAEEKVTLIGAISRLASNQVSISTPRGIFSMSVVDNLEVVKDRIYHGLLHLRVGDEISVSCKLIGRPIAYKLWANVVTFSAMVKDINGDEIEVVTVLG